ncbi:hypothetical protein [Nonomuraea pusilla]|uniref:Uncharacterized protein n=1 Tax=Nonomuraea pusilla TaxID=46177 RepID=A0A1H8ERG1_9ACTN|nr:hypothetical protein [Nonomuraea pusilla]SEN21467.1 hypothetical protein SAMN05660976_07061 [Nonomuraea pusilla]
MVLRGPSPSQQHVVEDAGQAYAEGRRIFVARFSAPLDKAPEGSSLPVISWIIEEIEAQGWHLEHMATSVLVAGFNRHDNITCLFRRSE